MVPTLEFPPGTPSTLQVRAFVVPPVTVAEKTWVALEENRTLAGLTGETVTPAWAGARAPAKARPRQRFVIRVIQFKSRINIRGDGVGSTSKAQLQGMFGLQSE